MYMMSHFLNCFMEGVMDGFIYLSLFMVLKYISILVVNKHTDTMKARCFEYERQQKAFELLGANLWDTKIAEYVWLDNQYVTILSAGGINTLGDLLNATDEKLLSIKGIKGTRLAHIRNVIATAELKADWTDEDVLAYGNGKREATLVEDEFFSSPIYKAMVAVANFRIPKTTGNN